MEYHIERDQTTDEVLGGMDLTGRRVLVTGAGGGLGLETCRALAVRGAEIVGTARDLEKARAAAAAVMGDFSGSVELVNMDLASLHIVRHCAESLLSTGEPFDVVVCNAGVMAIPEGKTEDGFETQFGVNHLGHFLLVNLIAPLLRSGSRVIVLSSMAHRQADIDLDDPNFERKPYDPWVSYGASKTANVLFAVELDKRLQSRGIRAASVHPGVITDTSLSRYLPEEEFAAYLNSDRDIHQRNKSIPEGAATTVWSAFVAPADDVGGRYCQDTQVSLTNDSDAVSSAGPRAYAMDAARAAELWKLSERLVGQSFTLG